jgi:hypothetical protein
MALACLSSREPATKLASLKLPRIDVGASSEDVDGIVAARESFREIQAWVAKRLRSSDSFLDGPRVRVRSLDSGILFECDPYRFLKSEGLTRPCGGRLGLGGRTRGKQNHA